MIDNFRRLIISIPASKQKYGQLLIAAAEKTSTPIHYVVSDIDAIQNKLAQKSGSLVILDKPEKGWIRKADHGKLTIRPNEYYIDSIIGCQSTCSYCYLQALDVGRLPVRVHVNIHSLLEDLRSTIDKDKELKIFATGELADSLSEINLIPISIDLINFFSMERKATLELRTKYSKIEPILELEHNGNTTISYSIIPSIWAEHYEHNTSPVMERLQAARLCQLANYPVEINFEPFLIQNGWERVYANLIAEIGNFLDWEKIQLVKVGSIRWSKQLEEIRGFQRDYKHLFEEKESIEFRNAKYNYTINKSERLQAYYQLREMLLKANPQIDIWWSMEDPQLVSSLH